MHPSENNLSEYIKVVPGRHFELDNSLLRRIDASGYDIEDLASITCLSTRRLHQLVEDGDFPDERERDLLESAFLLVPGTLKSEYGEIHG